MPDQPDEYLDALDEPRRGEIARLHRLIRETLPALEPHIASGAECGGGGYLAELPPAGALAQ